VPKTNIIKRKDKLTKEVTIEERLVQASGENAHSGKMKIDFLQEFLLRRSKE
jgi:hypothetical protein